MENVTVAQGRDATFTCVVNNLGGYRVSASESGTPARVRTRFLYACLKLLNVFVRPMTESPAVGGQLDKTKYLQFIFNYL